MRRIKMSEKRYEVLDECNHVIATEMDLRTALLLMKAFCEEYYMETVKLTLKELDRCDTDKEAKRE
jgi:hypothetical protein|nr:MAG: hypothetical protein [Bacteriophage sp.]